MRVALKIDVDTHQGLKLGVPRLARALEQAGVAASFYISMGSDNSGRAIRRPFTNRGFLKKMFRTRAVGMYGLRTVLSGTLLPSRPIALAFPSIVREIRQRGFEVAIHGHDHVLWQDKIDTLTEDQIRNEIEEAIEAYRAIFDHLPVAFAAPGWRVNDLALKALSACGFAYFSNTRGREPYRCRASGVPISIPEIPTTLPTLDEVMGRPELRDNSQIIRFYLDRLDEARLNVHTIHAETEGMGQLDCFVGLLRAIKERGGSFVKLEDVAADLKHAEPPVYDVVRVELDGRAGWVAGQGTESVLTTAVS